MFLFRMIKRLVFFVLTIYGLLWLARLPYQGKPLYQHAAILFQSQLASEGAKDIKTLVGGLLKTVGDEIQEDVTKDDQKQLDKLIEKKSKEKKNEY